MKKKKDNENWIDEVFEQPENHQTQKDGSELYGYNEESKFLSREYFFDLKNTLEMVWAARNPFNDNRSVMRAGLRLLHPDVYKLFFPVTYLMGLIADMFDSSSRTDALYEFWGGAFGQILLMVILGGIIALIVKLLGIG